MSEKVLRRSNTEFVGVLGLSFVIRRQPVLCWQAYIRKASLQQILMAEGITGNKLGVITLVAQGNIGIQTVGGIP